MIYFFYRHELKRIQRHELYVTLPTGRGPYPDFILGLSNQLLQLGKNIHSLEKKVIWQITKRVSTTWARQLFGLYIYTYTFIIFRYELCQVRWTCGITWRRGLTEVLFLAPSGYRSVWRSRVKNRQVIFNCTFFPGSAAARQPSVSLRKIYIILKIIGSLN